MYDDFVSHVSDTASGKRVIKASAYGKSVDLIVRGRPKTRDADAREVSRDESISGRSKGKRTFKVGPPTSTRKALSNGDVKKVRSSLEAAFLLI